MDRQPTVAIIPCTSQKADDPGPAREVWTGTHFQLTLMHVEEWYDYIYIMSFKYGLITPETVIEPYDMNIHFEPAPVRMRWKRMVMGQVVDLCRKFKEDGQAPFVASLYVGKADVDWLTKAIGGRGASHVLVPWAGKGTGARQEAAYAGENPFIVDGRDVRYVD